MICPHDIWIDERGRQVPASDPSRYAIARRAGSRIARAECERFGIAWTDGDIMTRPAGASDVRTAAMPAPAVATSPTTATTTGGRNRRRR
jgi:hypothetical protein